MAGNKTEDKSSNSTAGFHISSTSTNSTTGSAIGSKPQPLSKKSRSLQNIPNPSSKPNKVSLNLTPADDIIMSADINQKHSTTKSPNNAYTKCLHSRTSPIVPKKECNQTTITINKLSNLLQTNNQRFTNCVNKIIHSSSTENYDVNRLLEDLGLLTTIFNSTSDIASKFFRITSHSPHPHQPSIMPHTTLTLTHTLIIDTAKIEAIVEQTIAKILPKLLNHTQLWLPPTFPHRHPNPQLYPKSFQNPPQHSPKTRNPFTR